MEKTIFNVVKYTQKKYQLSRENKDLKITIKKATRLNNAHKARVCFQIGKLHIICFKKVKNSVLDPAGKQQG